MAPEKKEEILRVKGTLHWRNAPDGKPRQAWEPAVLGFWEIRVANSSDVYALRVRSRDVLMRSGMPVDFVVRRGRAIDVHPTEKSDTLDEMLLRVHRVQKLPFVLPLPLDDDYRAGHICCGGCRH